MPAAALWQSSVSLSVCDAHDAIRAAFAAPGFAGNAVHLKQPRWLRMREIASIHEVAAENDITINPTFERAGELLRDLGERLFGARADGPVEAVQPAGAGT